MFRLIIFSLFLFIFSVVNSMPEKNLSLTDSLFTLLNNSPNEKSKISIYNQLALEIQHYSIDTALLYCYNSTLDGHSDWRVPTVNDALSARVLKYELNSETESCNVADGWTSTVIHNPDIAEDGTGVSRNAYVVNRGNVRVTLSAITSDVTHTFMCIRTMR